MKRIRNSEHWISIKLQNRRKRKLTFYEIFRLLFDNCDMLGVDGFTDESVGACTFYSKLGAARYSQLYREKMIASQSPNHTQVLTAGSCPRIPIPAARKQQHSSLLLTKMRRSSSHDEICVERPSDETLP